MSARVLAGGHVELRACVARSTQAPPHELLLALRLRGGAKSKPSRPRSWKEQSTHHAAVRKHSIRVRRGKNEQAATYTKEARDNLRRVHAARRLREIEETEKRMERLKEERASDFNHQLRLEYMRANEEADRRHNEKYQTLEDYSDSVERQLEELRQKRGESRGLTVPEWRDGGHTNFWREVDKEVADEVDDLENPSKVWREAVEEGNVWKVAAFNRKFDGQTVPGASSQLALSVDVSAGGSLHDGGGGGMQLAERQAAGVDPGPVEYEEASSALEEQLDEQDRMDALQEQDARRRRRVEKKRRRRGLQAEAVQEQLQRLHSERELELA